MHVSRRGIFEAGRSILTATIGLSGATILSETTKAAEPPKSDQFSRQVAAFQIRRDAAQVYRDTSVPVHISNGDEERYADKRASFAKTLPHNDAGEVDANAFGAFIRALTSGKADGFETIPRDRTAETELNNPQATSPSTWLASTARRQFWNRPRRLPVPQLPATSVITQ
jgi:hypothetical protein